MDVGERGSVKRGDDTRKKSAVTCVSRVPPSSSRAPHSQPFFFFFSFCLILAFWFVLSQEFCNLLLLDVPYCS